MDTSTNKIDMETIYSKEMSKHTESMVEDIIRDAFYSARLKHPMIGYKHLTVEDYIAGLKTKQQ